jgi:predicted glycosyltransferase
MRVMIVVTHLLGSGHLARALTLARAYRAAGDTVCVVSGGMPVPMMTHGDPEVVQLPPLHVNGADFSNLMTAGGQPASPDYLKTRQAALLAQLSRFVPDVLITELFPFGRRMLRCEFASLLKAARAADRPPLICASIRDILAPPSKPAKALFADETIAAFYDAVLVHSDPALTPLELSWPVSRVLRPFVHYTGFVAPPPAGPHRKEAGKGEIIVSAGGGDVGGPVYETALAAATRLGHPLRLLVGGTDPHHRITALRNQAPADVTIEPARPDFRQMLYHATASVSLCGYNTALDILQAGTPAVFVPYDEGCEVEQGIRAHALAQRPGIAAVARAGLSAATLCAALEQVIGAPRRRAAPGRMDGAARTVSLTRALADAR